MLLKMQQNMHVKIYYKRKFNWEQDKRIILNQFCLY